MNTQNHLKATAMRLGRFNMNSLKLDRVTKMSFQDLLNFRMQKDGILKYRDFNKICGISRQQWDIFRMDNLDNKAITWIVG